MALILYAVMANETHAAQVDGAEIELVVVRELAAACGPSDHRSFQPSDEAVLAHSHVVSQISARTATLPAPPGVVFRSRDQVTRWLELHYGALSSALDFIGDRVAARVHVTGPGAADERAAGTELAAAAAECLRTLRRSAVASIPLRGERAAGAILSAAFLVESELWKDFAKRVEDEAKNSPTLGFDLTGPWPPYDFVQMELRG